MSGLASILLVDDNPRYIADALPMYGYEVTVARDGFQALKLVSNKNCKYDLILLDVMMPNMDGFQTLKAIRDIDKYKTVPIIMITALNEDQKQVHSLKFGADDYITKPFVLPNLLARIEALLRRANWGKESVPINVSIASDAPLEPLTSKQKDIMRLAAKGLSNGDIAEQLSISDTTVKTHMQKIFKKLNVSNRTQAILLAIQLKMIDD